MLITVGLTAFWDTVKLTLNAETRLPLRTSTVALWVLSGSPTLGLTVKVVLAPGASVSESLESTKLSLFIPVNS